MSMSLICILIATYMFLYFAHILKILDILQNTVYDTQIISTYDLTISQYYVFDQLLL